MPEVNRYGCNRAVEYLEPLVYSFGLRAVLLFPVVGKLSDLDQDEYDLDNSSSGLSRFSIASDDSSSCGDEEDQCADVLPERLLPPDEPATSQNPFLNQNEEEEDHLLADSINNVITSNPNRLTSEPIMRSEQVSRKNLKASDMRSIKNLAFKSGLNPVLRLIPRLREKFPNLLIICDVCLCAFTSTGHCCMFEESICTFSLPSHLAKDCLQIANERSRHYLAALSVEYARKGCHVIAPSDMMDGRVAAIRKRLDRHKLQNVSIMSYSAKFASSFYGPFRQASKNAPEFGDRQAYQLPVGSRALALRAVRRDIEQGADFVMVKPADPYLDIVRDIRETHPDIPIAVYQVSGEYSMLRLAASANILNLKLAVNEKMTSYRRAGANIIISYFTPQILKGELSVGDF